MNDYETIEYPEKDYKIDGSHLDRIKKYQKKLMFTMISLIVSIIISLVLAPMFDLIKFTVGTNILIAVICAMVIAFLYYFRIPRLRCSSCGKKMIKSYKHISGSPAEEALFLICKTCKLYVATGISTD